MRKRRSLHDLASENRDLMRIHRNKSDENSITASSLSTVISSKWLSRYELYVLAWLSGDFMEGENAIRSINFRETPSKQNDRERLGFHDRPWFCWHKLHFSQVSFTLLQEKILIVLKFMLLLSGVWNESVDFLHCVGMLVWSIAARVFQT